MNSTDGLTYPLNASAENVFTNQFNNPTNLTLDTNIFSKLANLTLDTKLFLLPFENISADTDHEGTSADFNTLFMFVMWGVALPLVATIGLLGNVVTMMVLWRREMMSPAILYMRGIVTTDTGILIGSLILLTPLACANYLQTGPLLHFKSHIYPLLHTPGYYVVMTLQQINVWITVAVSLERYISICHPFKAARLISTRKTVMVMACVALVSLIYNTPRAFSFEVISIRPNTSIHKYNETLLPNLNQTNFDDHISNRTLQQINFTNANIKSFTTPTLPSKDEILSYRSTKFGRSRFFMVYRSYMYCIIIYVVPFMLLLIFNSFIIRELMGMRKRSSIVTIAEENEANLSLVLVLMVVTFMLCQTPGLISQFNIIPDRYFNEWLAVSNFLFTCNSAVNFLIYTAFGRKFRFVLVRIFCHLFENKNEKAKRKASITYFANGLYAVDTQASRERLSEFNMRLSHALQSFPKNNTDNSQTSISVSHTFSVKNTFSGELGTSINTSAVTTPGNISANKSNNNIEDPSHTVLDFEHTSKSNIIKNDQEPNISESRKAVFDLLIESNKTKTKTKWLPLSSPYRYSLPSKLCTTQTKQVSFRRAVSTNNIMYDTLNKSKVSTHRQNMFRNEYLNCDCLKIRTPSEINRDVKDEGTPLISNLEDSQRFSMEKNQS